MSRIALGTLAGDGKTVWLDLETLVATRLLVQANSGGGKSWTLRRILEQSHGKVQQIVIDPEGEFASLREKFDYVVAGKGGDVAIEPKIAALLAHRLLDLRANAILDLYEMRRMGDRREFVKLFLEALVNAPTRLWHPALVVIDEAHVYCPEGKEAESSDAVIGLCQRGRKRGFCAALATQRLATLSKDAAAQCGNVLIGPTTLDIDCKRATQALGLARDRQPALIEQLMRLDPGQFFALGRAVSKEMTLVKVGPVETHHPEIAVGRRAALGPPPPPERVRAMLPKLSDLPREAEQEATKLAALRTGLREAKAELAALKRRAAASEKRRPGPDPEARKALAALRIEFDTYVSRASVQLTKATRALAGIAKTAAEAAEIESPERTVGAHGGAPDALVRPPAGGSATGTTRKRACATESGSHAAALQDDHLRAGALRMLRTLARHHPVVMTRSQLGTLSGFTPRGGTFGAYLGDLRRAGFIEINGREVAITDAGLDRAGEVPPTPTTPEERREVWRDALRAGERKMLDALMAVYPAWVSREDLAETTGFEPTGGTFNAYLGTLRRNGLAEVNRGEVRAGEALFA